MRASSLTTATTTATIVLISCVAFAFYNANEMAANLIKFDFEIFGRVQGVFFRKCTAEEAQRLGLRGWCKNMPQGTVQGQAEGPEDQMKLMKHWLQEVGSPMSKIEKAVFTNEGPITKYSFEDFGVIRKKK